jgi:hypothetical protein
MALARAGKLRSSDPVLRQGTDQWVRADQARSEGPPGLPQAPVAMPVAMPSYGGPAPMMQPGGAPVPPPMYGGPTSGALAAMGPGMGPPRFMPMPTAENEFDGNGYGAGYGAGYGQGAGESHQGTAITSFVLSLVGLFIFGAGCGAAAIGTGIKALNGMKVSGNTSGRGLAIAGIVIGVLDIIGVMFFLATRHTHR